MAVPLKLVNDMPGEELAGKIVLDTNTPLRRARVRHRRQQSLSEAWRRESGQPAWEALQHHTRDELIASLAQARPAERVENPSAD